MDRSHSKNVQQGFTSFSFPFFFSFFHIPFCVLKTFMSRSYVSYLVFISIILVYNVQMAFVCFASVLDFRQYLLLRNFHLERFSFQLLNAKRNRSYSINGLLRLNTTKQKNKTLAKIDKKKILSTVWYASYSTDTQLKKWERLIIDSYYFNCYTSIFETHLAHLMG